MDRFMKYNAILYLIMTLTACGGGGGGGSGATNNSAPTVPGNVTVEAISSSQINVSWTASSDDVAVAGYNIYRGGMNWSSTADTAISDTGLSEGVQYCYAVSAYDSDGNESGQSNQLCATTFMSSADSSAPTVPTALGASPQSNDQINLSWIASTDDVAVSGYKVYRDSVYLKSVTGTSTSDTALSSATYYCYAVLAYDSAGNESVLSSEACATTGTSSDVSAPIIPTGLSASAVSSSQIDLSWNASSDNVGVVGYEIYRDSVFLKWVTGTNASDTALSASANYCYSVLAYDAANNKSNQTSQVCAVTQAPSVNTPAAPSNVTVSNITENSATLSWADNSDNETGFEIGYCSGLVSSTGGGLYSCVSGFTAVASVGANSTSYNLTGLLSETTYSRFVRAYNASGDSANVGINFATAAAVSSSTLTITNNFSDGGSNKVLQLRIASTDAGARSDSNELLSPDETCIYLGPDDIAPTESLTYTIPNNMAANGYYVFIGMGIWDGSWCSDFYFGKKMWSVDNNFNTFWIYQVIILDPSETDGKDVELQLGYSGNTMTIFGYSNGLSIGSIPFVVSYSDPTTP